MRKPKIGLKLSPAVRADGRRGIYLTAAGGAVLHLNLSGLLGLLLLIYRLLIILLLRLLLINRLLLVALLRRLLLIRSVVALLRVVLLLRLLGSDAEADDEAYQAEEAEPLVACGQTAVLRDFSAKEDKEDDEPGGNDEAYESDDERP